MTTTAFPGWIILTWRANFAYRRYGAFRIYCHDSIRRNLLSCSRSGLSGLMPGMFTIISNSSKSFDRGSQRFLLRDHPVLRRCHCTVKQGTAKGRTYCLDLDLLGRIGVEVVSGNFWGGGEKKKKKKPKKKINGCPRTREFNCNRSPIPLLAPVTIRDIFIQNPIGYPRCLSKEVLLPVGPSQKNLPILSALTSPFEGFLPLPP